MVVAHARAHTSCGRGLGPACPCATVLAARHAQPGPVGGFAGRRVQHGHARPTATPGSATAAPGPVAASPCPKTAGGHRGTCRESDQRHRPWPMRATCWTTPPNWPDWPWRFMPWQGHPSCQPCRWTRPRPRRWSAHSTTSSRTLRATARHATTQRPCLASAGCKTGHCTRACTPPNWPRLGHAVRSSHSNQATGSGMGLVPGTAQLRDAQGDLQASEEPARCDFFHRCAAVECPQRQEI
jgi:hypothetical protein